MANIRTGSIVARWKTFYECTCPEQPPSGKNRDVHRWYMHHYDNCPPRRIQNVLLPAYPIEGE